MRHLLAALLLTTTCALPVSAATVQLTGVTGVWLNPNPSNPTGYTGGGTSSISWGSPSTSAGKSGYDFVGAPVPQGLTPSVGFALGTFTHHNNLIYDSALTFAGATLAITYDFLVDSTSYTLSRNYLFTHWETPNAAKPCANGGKNGKGVNVNGCADRVQIVSNPSAQETVFIDGVRYTFNITEFQGLANEGGLPTFWTKEHASNSATLTGVFEEYVPPAPVPLPASALLLIGGMGGLAALRRRRG